MPLVTTDGTLESAVEQILSMRHKAIEHDCLKASIETFEARCGRFNDYSLKYAYVLVRSHSIGYIRISLFQNNLCASGVTIDTFAKHIQELC